MLALLGWLAQLCLPLAHASVMAERGLGLPGWCGVGSPALDAKLSELPSEIRDILGDRFSQGDHASDNCAKLCVAPVGTAPPPASSPTLALRVAGLESSPVEAPPPARSGHRLTPPVRGPPV
ncbi:MAG: hypothetical protein ACT4QA_06535 [Panacagrimonas sp.]